MDCHQLLQAALIHHRLQSPSLTSRLTIPAPAAHSSLVCLHAQLNQHVPTESSTSCFAEDEEPSRTRSPPLFEEEYGNAGGHSPDNTLQLEGSEGESDASPASPPSPPQRQASTGSTETELLPPPPLATGPPAPRPRSPRPPPQPRPATGRSREVGSSAGPSATRTGTPAAANPPVGRLPVQPPRLRPLETVRAQQQAEAAARKLGAQLAEVRAEKAAAKSRRTTAARGARLRTRPSAAAAASTVSADYFQLSDGEYELSDG